MQSLWLLHIKLHIKKQQTQIHSLAYTFATLTFSGEKGQCLPPKKVFCKPVSLTQVVFIIFTSLIPHFSPQWRPKTVYITLYLALLLFFLTHVSSSETQCAIVLRELKKDPRDLGSAPHLIKSKGDLGQSLSASLPLTGLL